jgi:hypothetical protein
MFFYRTLILKAGVTKMDSDQNTISRRSLVTRFGTGISGAVIAAAIPTEEQSSGDTSAPFVDPTSKYPKPPYPGQT